VVLRRVLSTGKPEDVEWKGRHPQIIPHDPLPASGKLARLRPHPEALQDDPESIVHLDWSLAWQGGDNRRLS
jgi:hypothetical protein